MVTNFRRLRLAFTKRVSLEQSNNSFGASIVEGAVALLTFLILLMGTLELCWVLAVKTLMDYGTARGLEIAKVVEGFEVDTLHSSPQGQSLEALEGALTAIEQATLRLPLQALRPSAEQQLPRLVRYSVNHGQYQSEGDVAIMRPGSTAVDEFEEELSYPSSDENGGPVSVALQTIRMPEALKRFPIVIGIRAEIPSMIPLPGFKWQIRSRAIGYRERAVRESSEPDNPVPEAAPPTYTPVSSQSSSAGGSATSGSSSSSCSSSSSVCVPIACPEPEVFSYLGCYCRLPIGGG